MAGIINASETQMWSSANWVYWGLMDHLIRAFDRDESDVARRIEVCKWMQSLSIPLLREDDPELAEKIFTTLKRVAAQCASGVLVCLVDGKKLDDTSQQQFRDSMNDLVKVLSLAL
jgi:hypothetical protein